jgi:hypothetical protein
MDPEAAFKCLGREQATCRNLIRGGCSNNLAKLTRLSRPKEQRLQGMSVFVLLFTLGQHHHRFADGFRQPWPGFHYRGQARVNVNGLSRECAVSCAALGR